jgi:hypothetical protein
MRAAKVPHTAAKRHGDMHIWHENATSLYMVTCCLSSNLNIYLCVHPFNCLEPILKNRQNCMCKIVFSAPRKKIWMNFSGSVLCVCVSKKGHEACPFFALGFHFRCFRALVSWASLPISNCFHSHSSFTPFSSLLSFDVWFVTRNTHICLTGSVFYIIFDFSSTTPFVSVTVSLLQVMAKS